MPDGEAPVELAYALTVHKAQGSEFGRVILVLPNPCRLLSRHRNRVVIAFQGNPAELRNYSRSEHSETARRLTNLFTEPDPVVVKDRRYDGKHIHCTARGELVMSKSEVIIANELHRRGIDYAYEKELHFGSGRTCRPDFLGRHMKTASVPFWDSASRL